MSAKSSAENVVTKRIQKAIDKNSTVLDLSDMKLKSLPALISEARLLRVINLAGNCLSEIPPELAPLSSLQRVDLSSNKLTSGLKSLEGWCSLTCLDISTNELRDEAFEGLRLPNLVQFKCDYSQLSVIPEFLRDCRALELLSLTDNKISAVPCWLWELQSLVALELSSNQISCVQEAPEGAGDCKLQRLCLCQNKLTELPMCVPRMPELTDFCMTENRLSALPAWVGECSQIEQMKLADNAFRQVPKVISKLKKLTWLQLDKNRLESLEPWLGELETLQSIGLSDNPRLNLPEELLGESWCGLSPSAPAKIVQYFLSHGPCLTPLEAENGDSELEEKQQPVPIQQSQPTHIYDIDELISKAGSGYQLISSMSESLDRHPSVTYCEIEAHAVTIQELDTCFRNGLAVGLDYCEALRTFFDALTAASELGAPVLFAFLTDVAQRLAEFGITQELCEELDVWTLHEIPNDMILEPLYDFSQSGGDDEEEAAIDWLELIRNRFEDLEARWDGMDPCTEAMEVIKTRRAELYFRRA